MKYRLFKRGEVWWMDARIASGRLRRSLGVSGDRVGAERAATDLLQRLGGVSDVLTLRDAVRFTVRDRWAGTKGEGTATFNASVALKYFGADTPVAEVTGARIADYAAHLASTGNANGTINRKLAALSAVLRTSEARGGPAVPRMPRRREPVGRLRWLETEEEHRLLRAAEVYPDLKRLLVFLVDTGCRLGEALRLSPQDVTEDRVHLWETKSNTPRTVPLTKRAQTVVADGTFDLTRNAVRHQFERVRHMAKLGDDVVLHTLRHTCASRLVQRGVPLAVVREWLGHASITTTMRYSHLSPVHLEQARDALED